MCITIRCRPTTLTGGGLSSNVRAQEMRAENFSWSGSIYLHVGDLELDIHNCYDFCLTTYNVEARTVSLEWRRAKGDWVSETLPQHVRLTMAGIYHFSVRPRDPEIPFTEDDCLEGFGYDCDEDWADGQFWTDASPDPAWRWSFVFQSGLEIQVGGDSASVMVEP